MKQTISRRNFLALAATMPVFINTSASATTMAAPGKKTVGIALGGGGARGLAHVEMLAVLDELGIRAHRISGTSMGAVIAALYAEGRSAAKIKSIVDAALTQHHGSIGFIRKEMLEWIDLVDPSIGKKSLLNTSDFISFIHDQIKAKTFAELKIPLRVVAADIQRREQVILHKDDLATALKASFAFPGLFDPVTIQDRTLVDGGIVNPVPYDLLLDECDITIAVDVAGNDTYVPQAKHSFFEVIHESFQTMENTILQAKMTDQPPGIYVKPDLVDIRLLDYPKAEEIYRQARPAREQLKHSLQQLLV